MQVGVKPRAVTGVQVLGDVVGGFPVALGIVPKGEEEEIFGGRGWGGFERFEGHGKDAIKRGLMGHRFNGFNG